MSNDHDRIWALVHAERRALIDDLEPLSGDQWDTASLSQGWTVRDVAAHLVDNADFRWRGLAAGLVRHRFNFDAMNQAGMQSRRGATPAQTLDGLRAVLDLRATPPVALASRLVEEVAHGEDIRRSLGIVRDYPTEAVLPALDYQLRTSDGVGGAKQRLGKVRLQATDADFVHGDGPLVSGPVLELLLLASGQGAHARDLAGELDGPV